MLCLMKHTTALLALSALGVSVLVACAPVASLDPATELVLSSPDLDADGRLPAWATNTVGGACQGENRSPELAWTGVPAGTRSLALTMTDPAHPSYDHWVVSGIPADSSGMPSAAAGEVDLGVVGESWRGAGVYAGVCLADNPYVYTLYALDAEVDADASTDVAELLALIDGHVLASAELEVLRAETPGD